MRSNEVYPSKYLKAEDIEEDMTVVITKVQLEKLESNDGRVQDKPVAYFKGTEKGLILNKTNWALIAKQHGDESDNWSGKMVTLTTMDVEAFGDIVSAIRIKPQRKTPATTKSAPAPDPDAVPEVPDAETNPVTLFWTTAKQLGYERKDALAVLARCKSDFTAALLAISEEKPF